VSESTAAWARAAAGWERRRAFVWDSTRVVGERLVERVAARPGETLLELAAGPGDTGFLAAPLLEPGGLLLSTDAVPEMVAVARRRAAELGVENVEFRVLDAQAIALADASVDAVLCRWGYMLVEEPARALAETRRVLRPGGRLAFAVWAEAEANPWGTAPGRALLELGLIERPDPDAPGPFRLGDAGRVRALVREAGFSEPRVEEVPITWRYPSVDDFWQTTLDLSTMLAQAIEHLSAEEVERVRARAGTALEPHAQGAALAVPGLTRVVSARLPR
jgi:SAM-dependent methyltransferase